MRGPQPGCPHRDRLRELDYPIAAIKGPPLGWTG
jgi:hypothetical protein